MIALLFLLVSLTASGGTIGNFATHFARQNHAGKIREKYDKIEEKLLFSMISELIGLLSNLVGKLPFENAFFVAEPATLHLICISSEDCKKYLKNMIK